MSIYAENLLVFYEV